MTTDQVHPNPEGLHFQWSTLLAATWYSHGHPHGTILCQHMQNSLSLANLMHSQILQEDEILASFDVVSLFPNVPEDLAVSVAR